MPRASKRARNCEDMRAAKKRKGEDAPYDIPDIFICVYQCDDAARRGSVVRLIPSIMDYHTFWKYQTFSPHMRLFVCNLVLVIPLHSARRAMAAAPPLPEQRRLLQINLFLCLSRQSGVSRTYRKHKPTKERRTRKRTHKRFGGRQC